MSMQQTDQWVSVDQIVAQYLNTNEVSVNKKFKIWQLAFRGMEEMGLDFFYQIRSVKLAVTSTKVINLPDDCIKYTKVGVLNDRGEIIPLKFNNKLTTFAALLPDRITKTEDNTLFNLFKWDAPVWYNYWDGNGYTQLYGVPSGAPFIGTFKVDPSQNVIILGDDFQYNYVMVEYVASPKEDGDYKVPIQFRGALIAFIALEDVPSKLKGSAMWSRLSHDFYNKRRLAKARYKPFYIEQAYEWALENQRLVVKA